MAPVREDAELRGKSTEILDAFTRSVAREGYDGTSFSIIATELGISRGLIAHHFGTKELLFATSHSSYMRRRIDEAVRILDELPTPAEQLAGFLYAAILVQTFDRDATVAFQREVARLAKEDEGSEGRKLRAEYTELVCDVLDAGVATGEFRAGDTKTRSLLIFGSVHWAWTWFRPEGPKSVDQIGAEIVDLMLGSLLVSRRRLARLADPDGAIVATVRDILANGHRAPAKSRSA